MMTDSDNPYRTPASDAVTVSNAPQSESVDLPTLAAWPIVFGLNLILPMILSEELTRNHGRAGIFLASLFIIVGGWVLCVASPSTARRVIFGAVLVALTQVFPVLHVVVGLFSIGIAESLHLMDVGNEPDLGDGFHITSELGGFVVTMLVGGMLLTCATVIGVVFSLVLPQRWFTPRRSRYSPD